MSTALTRTQPSLPPAITSKAFTTVEQYYYKVYNLYKIEDYDRLSLNDGTYQGADLARFHIGNVLKMVYRIVGLKPENEPGPELAKVMAKYIQVTYPYIAPEEIYTAFELCLQGKYLKNSGKDNDLEHYQMMDLRYINKMLQAYVKFRFDGVNSMLKKLEEITGHKEEELLTSMPRNDQAVKELIRQAYKNFMDEPKERSWYMFLRPAYFDWLVDLGLIKYERLWLTAKYKLLRQRYPDMTYQEAINRVKLMAIGRFFGKCKMNNNPFKIFESVCYIDLGTLENLTVMRNGKHNLGI